MYVFFTINSLVSLITPLTLSFHDLVLSLAMAIKVPVAIKDCNVCIMLPEQHVGFVKGITSLFSSNIVV